MNKLSFTTLNVRGLNSSRKRRAIFRQLHINKNSIIFLQETYSSTEQEKLWNNKHILIDGKSVYWKEWHDAGILRTKDLLDESNRFITPNKFLIKTGLKVPFDH